LHILQNKSVGNCRYLLQKYCQIPTFRITDESVAILVSVALKYGATGRTAPLQGGDVGSELREKALVAGLCGAVDVAGIAG
jgi:hypothetical protein